MTNGECMSKEAPRKRGPEPAKGRLEYSNDLADTRLFLSLVVQLMHRLDEGRRVMYENDLDLACVASAVSTQSSLMRLAEFRDQFRDIRNVIGIEGQNGINALSLSQYTGIPRETVRRKLKRLTELGVVIEKSRGAYVMKPGFSQKPEHVALYHEAMRFTLQFMNDCLAMGLVKIAEK